MLRPRIIPTLLVHAGGLVKTVEFAQPTYVGDPINAVRIFNEKEVDELIVADIDATVQGRAPDYSLIARLAAECRMPLCYSGGIRSSGEIERIISLGVEKVAIGSAAVLSPDLIPEASRRLGNQSIVVVLDVRKVPRTGSYEVWTHNGTRASGLDPVALARRAEQMGAGEILVNAIDRDGLMVGYDFDLLDQVRAAVSVPLTALGGVGTLDHIKDLIARYGVVGAAAGSLFVFKGRFRAVLINYPSRQQKDELCAVPGVWPRPWTY